MAHDEKKYNYLRQKVSLNTVLQEIMNPMKEFKKGTDIHEINFNN